MGRKHWSDKPAHPSHAWGADGHCIGCMMHMGWPGARDRCTMRVKNKPPRTPKPVNPRRPKRVSEDDVG